MCAPQSRGNAPSHQTLVQHRSSSLDLHSSGKNFLVSRDTSSNAFVHYAPDLLDLPSDLGRGKVMPLVVVDDLRDGFLLEENISPAGLEK